jgi:tRNA (guanine37-N1)-methyltransferase
MKNKVSSFDIIGSRDKAVAIIEIPDELKNKEIKIAKKIMNRHKNVKSVLKRISERKGIFRTRQYKLLIGDKNTEVVHKEHGCKFKLDPMKVYFSEREGTERLRISKQVKSKETVMLMFAGVGPYGIIILKKQPLAKVIVIEINPVAFEYMKENIRINRMSDRMIPILGDVEKKVEKWYGKCDRAIMPLPHESLKFLTKAYRCLKSKGGIIHLYIIEKEENVKQEAEKIVADLIKKTQRKIKFKIKNVLPYSPGKSKYCLDIKVS